MRSYWIKTSSSRCAPVRKLLKPFSLPTPRVFATDGRRMSASIIRTGPCRCANDMARLVAVDVFPSPIWALVTSRVWGGRGAVESKTEVRRLRKDSAMGDEGRVKHSHAHAFWPAERLGVGGVRGQLLPPRRVGFRGDHGQGRSVHEAFRLFGGPHRAVKSFLHKGQGNAQNQPEHQSGREIARAIGADGSSRGWWRDR